MLGESPIQSLGFSVGAEQTCEISWMSSDSRLSPSEQSMMHETERDLLISACEILKFRHTPATNAHHLPRRVSRECHCFSEHHIHWPQSSVAACQRFPHHSRQLTYECHSFAPLVASPAYCWHVHYHISLLRIHMPSHSPFPPTQTQTTIFRTHAPALPSTSFQPREHQHQT